VRRAALAPEGRQDAARQRLTPPRSERTGRSRAQGESPMRPKMPFQLDRPPKETRMTCSLFCLCRDSPTERPAKVISAK